MRCLECAAFRRAEQKRQARRRCYLRHRAHHAEVRRRWERAHRDKARARFRRSYWRDPEHFRAASRRWAADNAQRGRERSRRYRQGLAAALVERYDDFAIFARDGWMCWLCRRPVDRRLPRHDRAGATIDHVVPVKHGGTDEQANVRLAHRACNSSKRDRDDYTGPWPAID